ncbi:MAG: tetratricopeptide repeat protein [Planctomycetaceae bacterium]|jgi:tetratricopeptide (TPR) repeat protein|nr:tetratricopeptide repeat protein [Planctomycetaceae bacterium]
MSTVSNESPQKTVDREKLQQLFAHGNKQMSIGSHDYANDMFTQCVLNDPENIIYFKSFLANLKKKYGDKKKKGLITFITGSGKKFHSKKPDQAFKASIETLKSDPWNVNALLSAGEACEELGHHNVAIEYYKAAIDSEPFHLEANRICGAALREIADYDGALACVHRILKAKPGDQDAEKLRKDLTVEKTIHKGKYATGDANQVRDAATKPTGIEEDVDVMGRPLTYLEQVEKRIKKNPDDIANYLELAQHFYQQADYEKSEQYYLQSVQLSKNSPDLIERLLDTQKQKLHAKVLALKEEFEKTKKESTKTEFYKTKEEYDAKNLELAQHRIQHHPNHAGYHFEYGVLLQQRKQLKEAIAEFQLAKAEVTRKGECLLALGQCFQMIKQTKLAMTHYQDAVVALPDGEHKKKALYLAAKLAFELEDYEKSEEYGHQLAAIDFSYKDLGELLDKVAQKRHN